jgi:hypothetical protein
MLQPESKKGLVWVESVAFPGQYFWQRFFSSFGRQFYSWVKANRVEKNDFFVQRTSVALP